MQVHDGACQLDPQRRAPSSHTSHHLRISCHISTGIAGAANVLECFRVAILPRLAETTAAACSMCEWVATSNTVCAACWASGVHIVW